ncbi:hypothetical protein [Marinobacterium litorale]|uniref:hypothetical protein n=1 Tax=Marinobacterium litorale TaxID=404770 RepID=UPI0003FD8DE1|nr:hypothetical protein [Marinobacterium litorale]
MPPRKRTTPTQQGETEVQNATESGAADVQDLVSANEEFAKQNERLEKENEELKAQAHSSFAIIQDLQKRFEVMEQQIGQDGVAHFDDSDLVRVEGRTMDDPLMKQKADMLKFMEEPVTIYIHDVSEDQADPGFPIFVNGECEIFRRDEERTVKRKFVEGLARAKKTGYSNQLKVDPETGVQEYVWPSKTGLRYPFNVVHDGNPNGASWLKSVLRQQ